MGRIDVDEMLQVARSLRGRFTVEAFRDELRRIGSQRPRLTPPQIKARAVARAVRAAVKRAAKTENPPKSAEPPQA